MRPYCVYRFVPSVHTSQNLLEVPSTNSNRRRPPAFAAGAALFAGAAAGGAAAAVVAAGFGFAVPRALAGLAVLAGGAATAVVAAGSGAAAGAPPASASPRPQSSTSYRNRVPPCSTRLTDVLCTNTTYDSRCVGRIVAVSPGDRPS